MSAYGRSTEGMTSEGVEACPTGHSGGDPLTLINVGSKGFLGSDATASE